jgi:polysaccharide pyruvyl transferase WcaK-like protein
MQPVQDEPMSNTFGECWSKNGGKALNLIHLNEAGIPALVREIASCEVVVAMRLHALILAAACGIPSVALSYDPKVTAFMESTGQGDACIDLARKDSLQDILRLVWLTREERSVKLQTLLPGLLNAASRNGEIAVGIVR